jgi:Type IV secretion system pilin
MFLAKRIKYFFISACLFVSMVILVSALSSTALAADASASCTKTTTFLGIPSWYEYLNVQLDAGTGICQTTAPNGGNPIPFIALAVVDILLKVAALVALIFVVYGGFRFATAQGSPEAISKGKKTVINAIIGLVIAVLASQIVKFAAYLLSK